MGKQKMTPIGIACILLVLLVVAFMVRGSLREPEKIVLPPEPSTTEPSGPTVDNEAVDRVEVRPDTVQSAIEVLARPRVYTRTITVERYWSGGSGVSVITVAAADGWLRLDVTETDGQTRHVITGDDAVYIWYGSSRKVYSGASALTQDAEQGILTYEDILALPPERITQLICWTVFTGRRSSVSREAGLPPRTSTPAQAPCSQRIAVQPVACSKSWAWPILKPLIWETGISFINPTS